MALTNGVIDYRARTDDGLTVLGIHFSGDGAYPAGGSVDFKAWLNALVKATNDAKADANIRGYENLTPIAVIPGRAAKLVPSYDITNDKLYVYDNNTDAENAVGNISGTTFYCTVIAN